MSRGTIRYQPALDGVRAVAVSVVLLFHGGISWMTGGYLGVSVFFTLSGFLITSLLLHEHGASGRIAAGAFYGRRARRLLPASLLCLLVVCLMAWAGWFRGVDGLRADVLGALFQVFNWVELFGGGGYGEQFAEAGGFQSPLLHYWSLAIEEQFYWVWPLAFTGLMALTRRWRTTPVTLIGWMAAVSALAAPVIAFAWSTDAAYYATPARMSEILLGAFAACWAFGRELPAGWRHAAPLALMALFVACVVFPAAGGPAYHGALPLVAVASAALILGLQVDGPVRLMLGVRPLVGLGKISYGVYLYHWPVYVLVDRQQWDLPVGVALALKVAITLAVALVSYFALELPVRTAQWVLPRHTLVAAVAGTAIVLGAAFVVPQTAKFYGVDESAAEQASIDTGPVVPLVPLTPSTTVVPPTTDVPASIDTLPGPTTLPAPTTTEALVPPRPVRIVIVGDSTAEAVGTGMVAWAAANPTLAQVEVVAWPGCGLSMGGVLVFDGAPERDVRDECSYFVEGVVPERIAALQPDVVMLHTTTWDVADRRVEAGGEVLPSNHPDVLEQIRSSFQALTDRVLSLGAARVVWVTEPLPIVGMLGPSDRQRDPARHEALYGLMRDMAAADPAVRVAELAAWIDDAGLAIDIPSRPDAVHWTPEASLRIATEFLGPVLVREALT